MTPPLGFTDTGLTPGATYTYQVTASDPFGNTAVGATASITASSATALSTYATDVLQDGASGYWRLGETSGSTVYDWAGHNDLHAGTGIAGGAAGAISGDANPASTFSGASNGSGSAIESRPDGRPATLSVEAWFKTTSTAGGKIVGFGDQNTGPSFTYDRHIYMDTSGHVYFGVQSSGQQSVRSPATYNDGKWHQAVGTLGANGLILYVDGKQVSSNSSVKSAANYQGYWHIGGDSSWSGAPYFTGTIDDVSIFRPHSRPRRCKPTTRPT